MDTQTQIDRLIELAIIQRTELKQLVEQLPQLREHLNAEVEKVFEETEPQLRAELEEWTTKQTADKTAALGVTLEAKIADLAKSLEISTQARYNAIIAEREENARLAAQAEAKIAEHAASLPSAVKEIVSAELARFPRAGEIDQLRKEFAEPRGLNPRGKWQAGETYNKLDLVTINGDSYTSNTDGNRTRPSRSSADWTLVAARGTGGGGGPTSLSELTTVPSDGDLLIGSGTSWVTSNLTAGAGISITVGPGAITISATDGDITLDDGTAASPSLHFTNDPDTGIYRPAANTLGISVSGTQIAYFDANGLTVPSAGVVAGGSFHGANGNANNPSFSFTSDQDTGFYRHGTNELGISIGGTEKAVMTSTTFSITPNVSTSGNLTVSGTGVSTLGASGARVLVNGATDDSSTNLQVSGNASLGTISVQAGPTTYAAYKMSFTAQAADEAFLVKFGTYKVLTGEGYDTPEVTKLYSNNTLALTLSSTQAATLAGNLTVSGGTATISAASAQATLNLTSSGGSGRQYQLFSDATGQAGIFDATGSTFPLLITTTTLSTARNLTVSGGTIGTAASTNLTLNGGSSGASLALGQGTTNGTVTITPTGGVPTTTLVGYVAAGALNSGNVNSADATATLRTRGNLVIDGTGRNANGADAYLIGFHADAGSVNGFVGSLVTSFINGANFGTATYFKTRNGAGAATEVGRFTATGNFLLGTTTDGGQKLQVSGTGYLSDSLRVGTSWSPLAWGVKAIEVNDAGGGLFAAYYNGTAKGYIVANSGDFAINTQGTNSLLLRTSGNTVLTLDSSQRAQFAGTTDSSSSNTGALTVAGGVGIAKKLYVADNIISTGSNAALFFNSRTGANSNYAWYSPDGTVARLYDNTNAKTLVDFAANTGDATFAGSIRQNQANNISLTSGVATTIFSLGTSAGVYIVTATLDVNAVAGYAIVGKGATGSWQVLANSGTQMSFSMSTNDLQITQSSGSTSTTNTFNLLRLR